MIYADYASTTPLDPEVLKRMEPYFSGYFGNGSSVHTFGREAAAAVERARSQIAQVLGAEKMKFILLPAVPKAIIGLFGEPHKKQTKRTAYYNFADRASRGFKYL